MLVVAHGDGHLEVFVRMKAAGILEMAFTKSAGVTEYSNDFILGRNRCILGAFIV